MYMNVLSHIVAANLCFAALFLPPVPPAIAQDSQDDQPHIQPRNSPTPTPTPTPKPAASQPPAPKKDQYDRPPFPGDVQQKPGANEPSPKPSDDKYERPPFPGDAPGTNPTGGSVSGESSSKDSQMDTDIHPDKEEPAAPAEDETVLRPWDPHKAAKDVEVGQYYLKLKNYRAALERFNHALTYKPNDAEATLGLAITQEKLDLLSPSSQNYRQYRDILPNAPNSKDAEAAFKRVSSHV